MLTLNERHSLLLISYPTSFSSSISALRHQCNQMAIEDMVIYLNGCNDGVAIFDATNHTHVRRADLVDKVNVGPEKVWNILQFVLFGGKGRCNQLL